MNEHDLKREAAIRAEREFKPEPLTEKLGESGKHLDDSLGFAARILEGLTNAQGLEIPSHPVANMRDLVNLNLEKTLTLRETLVNIAYVLGVLEVR